MFANINGTVIFPKKLRGFYRRNDYVFQNCTISQINFNPCINLYNIERLAKDTIVSEIIIPASCGKIESLAYNCTELANIYCYAEIPPQVSSLVYKIRKGGVLHVPSGSKDRYEQSDWMSASSEYSLAHYNWTVVEDL